MACRGWAMLALVLTAPGAAGALENGWSHDVDLAAGLGSGTVTAALSEVSAFGELVTRTPLQHGNDRFRRSTTLFFAAVTVRP